MKPSLRNLFMKWLTRDRVVPIISVNISWLILVRMGSGRPSFPKFASSSKRRASRFCGIEELINQIFLDTCIPQQDMEHEHLRRRRLVTKDPLEHCPSHPHCLAFRQCRGCCQALGLSDQTSLSAEIIGP